MTLVSILKRYRGLVGAAVVALALGYAFIRPVWPAESFVTEAVTFKTNAIRGTTNDEAIDIEATLYLPKAARFPISAVVIAPSSSGVEAEREVYYAKELVNAGIAALVVDSFKSRGLTDSLYDQTQLEQWDVGNDVIAALEYLIGDDRFKENRIAVMGVSKGGTVAMDTALKIRRKWMGVSDMGFAAHIAISPDCTWVTRQATTTGAPILFMLAELDDQTPAQACLQEAERIRNAGNKNVETKVYPGAHHAWEELGAAPQYDPEIENYSKCRVWVENDGRMVSADTGEQLPEDDWHGWAKKNCMTLGAHCCGGTRELKETAMRDVIVFLRRYRF
jgi:dienelactone hydrolase